MNQSIVIIPEVPFSAWFDDTSSHTVEEQIIKAIVDQLDPSVQHAFFNPDLKDIPNPNSLKDIDIAVELFIDALRARKKIVIVGDYDVDGITATAILIRFLKLLDFDNFDYFIPNRFIHGYGLTEKTVEAVLAKAPELVITVDNGITAKQEIEIIKRKGIQIIVTDHHLPQEDSLPDCAILNPKQPDCTYPDENLSGVGVVFLFLIGLRAKLREMGYWKGNRKEPNLAEHLDLVALGTIADQVPLLGINRVFAKFGLDQMTRRIQEGFPTSNYYYLKTFAEKTRTRTFSSDSIAFSLAPLLNATGRMKDAEEGLSFLLADNDQVALSRYQYLDRLNQKRRKKQQTMSKKAMEQAERLIKQGKSIVVYDKSFHEGLIGVIASRLVDQFFFPSVVATEGENGILKASCRSKNENIMDILKECEPFIIQYGGHANAAGLSIEKNRLKEFHKRFTEVCSEFIPGDREYRVNANIEVMIDMMTFSLINKLRVLEPYGHMNRKPVFMVKDIKLPIPTIMTGRHLKWVLERDLELIFWNGADMVAHSESYDIAFTISENVFRGERKRQLVAQTIIPRKE